MQKRLVTECHLGDAHGPYFQQFRYVGSRDVRANLSDKHMEESELTVSAFLRLLEESIRLGLRSSIRFGTGAVGAPVIHASYPVTSASTLKKPRSM